MSYFRGELIHPGDIIRIKRSRCIVVRKSLDSADTCKKCALYNSFECSTFPCINSHMYPKKLKGGL